mmetsp:Transcript_23058/g.32488  ORF Transcript_23058/g.32488 Transcript_23058/m.32488 type:complete len:355 (-) Transcript_23058:25-1089(-)
MLCIYRLIKTPAPDDTANGKKILKECAAEFFGTAIFVYFGTLSAVSTGSILSSAEFGDVARIFPIAFCFGVSILSLVYTIGPISGGHMNPGVSLMTFFKGEMSLLKLIAYWSVQLFGSMAASAWVWLSVYHMSNDPPSFLGATTLDPDLSSGNGFLLELMGSFFFYFVISECASKIPQFAPIPIGLSLTVAHICLIPFTGCGVNPARTFGPAVVSCFGYNVQCSDVIASSWWIYWIGPFVASLLVAEFSIIQNWMVSVVPDEKDDDRNIAAKQHMDNDDDLSGDDNLSEEEAAPVKDIPIKEETTITQEVVTEKEEAVKHTNVRASLISGTMDHLGDVDMDMNDDDNVNNKPKL